MIDLIQVQKDIHGLLMSAPQLATVNIVEERKFILQQQVEVDAIWQNNRTAGGIEYSGNGLLIEVPTIECDSSGVTGPPQTVTLSFVSFQNGDAAFIPPTPASAPTIAGGGLFAEQIEQFLIDALHLQSISGLGTMMVSGRFSEPAREYAGLNARRTLIKVTPKQTAQTPRTGIVTVAIAAGVATLTTSTAGAAIYYTLDGSFPSNPAIAIEPLSNLPVNPGSTLYAAPFAAASGQVIRAAAYLNGCNPGQIIAITVP